MRAGMLVARRFQLEEVAGRGGMGEVWRARDLARSGASVALKVMLPDATDVARFMREAKLLARVKHSALVEHLADGVEQGSPWLAMEWLDGEALDRRLRRAPLSIGETLAIGKRVAGALAALHDSGVVHRDVKPSNVILRRGQPSDAVLLDLGIARSSSNTTLTSTNLVIGTVAYMAPEQAFAARGADARVDVYALGALLFECLTGEHVFRADNVIAVLAALLTTPARRPSEARSDLPPAVDDVVASMLSFEASARPRDGSAALDALDRISLASDALAGTPKVFATSRREHQLALGLVIDLGQTSGVADTVAADAPEHDVKRVLELVRALRGNAVPLDGSLLLIVIDVAGTVADQALVVARAALAILEQESAARAGIAAGLAPVSGRIPVGDVLSRAVRLARAASPGMTLVDSTFEELLADRFALTSHGDVRLLGAEQNADGARRVLGRVVPFLGREKELSLLDAMVAEAVEESSPRAALVIAPPGVGKSRLGRELLRRVRMRDRMKIVEARAEASSAGAANGLLRALVRKCVGLHATLHAGDGARLAQHLASLRGLENVMRAADFLGALIDAPPQREPTRELQAARHSPELYARWERRTVGEWLAAEARTSPVVMLLEDLHWSDAGSLGHLDHALRSLRDEPLCVIGLARPEVRDIHAVFGDAQEIWLTPLGHKSAEKMVRAILYVDVEPSVVQGVVARGSGNPLFLEELARFVGEGRGTELPATVLSVIQARLDQLESNHRAILRAASVLGERAPLGAVAAVTEMPSARIELAIPALEGAEIVQWEVEAGALAFRHALVRDAAYATISPEELPAAHLRAADWLERACATESELDACASALAEHLEKAGDEARAEELFWRAAEHESRGRDPGRAVELADRGLRTATGFSEGRLRLARGRAEARRGRAAEAGADAVRVMDLVGPGTREWCEAAQISIATAQAAGDAATVARTMNRILELPLGDEARVPTLILLCRSSVAIRFDGQSGVAEQLLDRGEQLAKTVDDPLALAFLHRARAWRAQYAGDPFLFGELMRESARCFEAIGDVRMQAIQQVNVAYAALLVGAFEDSIAAGENAIATLTALEEHDPIAICRSNLGLALSLAGRLDDAEREQRLALASAVARGNQHVITYAHANLAMLALMKRDGPTAEAEGRSALAHATHDPARAQALAIIAMALLEEGGDALASLGHAQEAHALLDRLGGVDSGEALIRLVYARALERTGDHEGAKRAIGHARDRLHARAANISNTGLRDGFFARIPEHAATLRLASEWLEGIVSVESR